MYVVCLDTVTRAVLFEGPLVHHVACLWLLNWTLQPVWEWTAER